jgi:ATP-dependent DNA helicase RecQ
VEESRLEMMRGYAEARSCRRWFLLSYFGEQHDGSCARCDVCATGRAQTPAPEGSYASGERVTHVEFGGGQVVRVEGDAVTVLFDGVGYKTISAEIAAERDLLQTGG